jgi:hypothetical protein
MGAIGLPGDAIAPTGRSYTGNSGFAAVRT